VGPEEARRQIAIGDQGCERGARFIGLAKLDVGFGKHPSRLGSGGRIELRVRKISSKFVDCQLGKAFRERAASLAKERGLRVRQ
jgi:hypothetical protein